MKKTKYLHIAIIILGIIFISIPVFHSNLWFDESYSVGMANKSFIDIWNIGSNDVHPILYYVSFGLAVCMVIIFIQNNFGNSISNIRNFRVYTYKKRLWRKRRYIIFIFHILFTNSLSLFR